MKELTIEEKAKAYDEAIERAKEMCAMPSDRATMEYVFPELRESEEERISKKLIDTFNFYDQAMNSPFLLGIHREDILAYLEKQKDFDKKLEQAYKANNEDIFNYGYKAAKAELGKEDDEDPRWKYAYDLIIADDMYQMSMNDEMVEEARTKALEALREIGTADLLHLEKQGKTATIDIDKMVLKYSQTRETCTNSLPINCQIRAYRQGINDALNLSLEIIDNSKWNK